jgi:hypothetical protein
VPSCVVFLRSPTVKTLHTPCHHCRTTAATRPPSPAPAGAPHTAGPAPLSVRLRRAQVGELLQQVGVRPRLVLRHLAIGEHAQEEIDYIVGERASIYGVADGPASAGLENA